MPIEIAVQDTAGALAAQGGGADRLEVCTSLALGGLTPSAGTLHACIETGMPSLPLIRPRPGDFTYSAHEVDVARRDICAAMHAGATGIVIGALIDGSLDRTTLRLWSDAALTINPHAEIVIHRCVDVLQSNGVTPEQLADMCEGIPVTRILTSGGRIIRQRRTPCARISPRHPGGTRDIRSSRRWTHTPGTPSFAQVSETSTFPLPPQRKPGPPAPVEVLQTSASQTLRSYNRSHAPLTKLFLVTNNDTGKRKIGCLARITATAGAYGAIYVRPPQGSLCPSRDSAYTPGAFMPSPCLASYTPSSRFWPS